MKTTDEIFADMKAKYAESAGKEIADESDMAIRMYAAAAEIESLYAYNDWVKAQAFPQTAAGEFLDRHGEMRGIVRRGAERASGTVRFYLREARGTATEIPEGTVCMTAAGNYFRTAETGEIAAGELWADVSAEAEEPGKGGNVLPGTIVFMAEAPAGVERCTNTARFTGGADSESDEELRERILKSYRSLPSGANSAYYEKTAASVEGVGKVLVTPKKRGLGTVDITVTARGGMPDEELISAVADVIENAREICVDVSVTAPESVEVDIEANVEAAEGYDAETVTDAVAAAVSAYFDGSLLGKSITRAKLGSIIYGVEGVENYEIVSPAADVHPQADELPVAGSVTISEWS